jgi:hypothetical protein
LHRRSFRLIARRNCQEKTQELNEKKNRKKIQPEEGRRVLMMNLGRKNPGRKRIFKPPHSVHFGFAADSGYPVK